MEHWQRVWPVLLTIITKTGITHTTNITTLKVRRRTKPKSQQYTNLQKEWIWQLQLRCRRNKDTNDFEDTTADNSAAAFATDCDEEDDDGDRKKKEQAQQVQVQPEKIRIRKDYQQHSKRTREQKVNGTFIVRQQIGCDDGLHKHDSDRGKLNMITKML